ncbi:MAG TPA: ECF transporter S component [Firmicutes bacterium]|jgi:thiamine transporter ThiT|nr:MAG: membrane protein [Peptococcaceae bacterium 1109]HHT72282.1 ECF transporter S component [Bacillota bacterium]
MKPKEIRRMVLAAFFIALGMILPYFTGQIPTIGRMLLPMHIPVLLCGFIVGGPYGLAVGLILPLFRSYLLGMPPLFPTAVAMTFELGAYGFLTGYLYRHLPKNSFTIYLSLVLAMLGGRAVWGLASLSLYGLSGQAFSWQLFMSGAFINAVPGIILQLIAIPAIVIALKKNGYLKRFS